MDEVETFGTNGVDELGSDALEGRQISESEILGSQIPGSKAPGSHTSGPRPTTGFQVDGDSVIPSEKLIGDRGGIVTARGTGDGLVLRLDGRVDGSGLKEAVIEFLNSRKGFLSGNEVALEWVGIVPHKALVDELSTLLLNEFAIRVRSSVLWEPPVRALPQRADEEETRSIASEPRSLASRVEKISVSRNRNIKPVSKFGSEEGLVRSPSLFDGIQAFGGMEEDVFADENRERRGEVSKLNSQKVGDRQPPIFDSSVWDDPDARIIYATLRSGQKIETEHTLIVFGDVNSGAEVISGGDIVILGTLRGIAHAGAYDETGGGRVIFALNLQPTQLRIGMTISRGSAEGSDKNVPEVARVEGNLIIVEPFNSRKNWGGRR